MTGNRVVDVMALIVQHPSIELIMCCDNARVQLYLMLEDVNTRGWQELPGSRPILGGLQLDPASCPDARTT